MPPVVLRQLLETLKLAELWLANCVPTVELEGPKPLPVIAAKIAELESALVGAVVPPPEEGWQPIETAPTDAFARLIAYCREQAECFNEEGLLSNRAGAAIRHEKQRVRDAYLDCATRLAALLPAPPVSAAPEGRPDAD
jgi:hypothetical protein